MEDNRNGNDLQFLIVVFIFLLLAMGIKTQAMVPFLIRKLWFQITLASAVGLLVIAIGFLIAYVVSEIQRRKHKDQAVIGETEDSILAGKDAEGRCIYIKPRQRGMHTQVVGTTNAGKTESVILPWAIQDIEKGRGLILIDGKADRTLLDKLWAYTKKYRREKDFRLFSLSNVESSSAFNPLLGGTSEEIAERVFNSFEFENPHYRSLQFDVFSQVLRSFEKAQVPPTFTRVRRLLEYPRELLALAKRGKDLSLIDWATKFKELTPSDREQRISGLIAALNHFSFGKSAPLFNTERCDFTLDEALKSNLIVYFQLPVLLSPFLGKATGKLVLQCLQSAIANRHRSKKKDQDFYSVFLDDFTEYLYPGFVSILNKSRSANVGVVFAHQALGDLKVLGDATANSILTNSNLKIFMRGNDPESAEYFSSVIGTKTGTKHTERQKLGLFRDHKTGDVSAREVEEFIVHPNSFKRDLGVGEAMMILPHDRGTLPLRVRFTPYPGRKIRSEIPKVQKLEAKAQVIITPDSSDETSELLSCANP